METAYEYRQDQEAPTQAAPSAEHARRARAAVLEMPRSIADVLLTPTERPSATAIQRAITVISRNALVEANMPKPADSRIILSPAASPRPADETTLPAVPVPPPSAPTHDSTPWPLQQFFNGDIDLDVELAQRFDNMPVMSRISLREMGEKTRRGVATLHNQDGASQVIIDLDSSSGMMHLAFTYGSMLTLRFRLTELGDLDRRRWLDLMKRDKGGLAFLWGPARWDRDYVICVSRGFLTNLYAFSPNGFEAGIRLTPEVHKQLLKWIDGYWAEQPKVEAEAPLLTW